MKEILDSIQPIVEHSRFVSIHNAAIEQFVASIKPEEFELSEFDSAPQIPEPSEERYIGFAIVYNTINFCYWGDPKWTIEIEEKRYDGSYALTQALIRAMREEYDILNPQYLASLPEADLRRILRGNVEIPLFNERLTLLRKLGSYICENFSGSWMEVVKKGKYDAEGIVRVLAGDMPDIFKDEAACDGNRVKFYKRAQLVPAYIAHDLCKTGAITLRITGTEKLTAFADYKVPQVLRKLGILVYSEKLAEKIDALTEIPAGSREEIDIRANTIEAVQRAMQLTQKGFLDATAARLDGILWFRGQQKSPDDKPYHRTKTVWY